ncbi:hypothetical protein TRFO_12764 [Tritrichomonas foetus]|uniref:Importin N-terminal domain-containing protein n=1 Tax=Tritrichomonas foetus TaxID=1144522 RepID=A0A1J4L1U9_9EUKA|nr:hypothetical protein TRFO_12764 [Tritrichomonas foetus]|eukprot:OHT17048.1 hypothetical protein TRFO_12764 [Tritrichomonas foetus]
MEHLTQEGTPVDISYFDLIVNNLYNVDQSRPQELVSEANAVLMKFQERSDAWLVSQQIITESQQIQSKFIALQTFTQGAREKWGMIDENQRAFFKRFFFDLFFQWSYSDVAPTLMSEACRALIEVLKNEWPTYWPNFMIDFLNACKKSHSTTLNGLKLLAILSEETHEYTDDMLTSDRMSEFSRALESDFNLIFTYLETVFLEIKDQNIIEQALHTLSHYLRWIDLQTITSTPLCHHLVTNLYPIPQMRLAVLYCFDAIATHSSATADQNMIQIFEILVHSIHQTLIAENQPITEVYAEPTINNQIIKSLGHFLVLDQSNLLLGILTEPAAMALHWLCQLTAKCSIETFKVAVEFWLSLTKTFFLESHKVQPPKELIYQLQEVFINRITRPPEFSFLVPDDFDCDDPVFYENMRQTIVCLSNLSRVNMVQQLLNFLRSAQNNEGILLSCWSIGAISGSLQKNEEQQFLVEVINYLYGFLQQNLPQDTQALFCGCYLFILSLYPRFLHNNWCYLKQLLEKIIQFIRTPFPPLQKMAVNTLKSIATSIPGPLLMKHMDQQQSFIYSILENAEQLASVLPMDFVPPLYEAMAIMIKSHNNEQEKASMVSKLLVLPVRSWEQSLVQLNTDTSCDNEITMKVLFPIDIFGKIILISNFAFYPQIEAVITRTMDLYRFYSIEVSKHSAHPNLLEIKTQILLLYEAFLKQHPDSEIVPGLVEMLTQDYVNSPPDFRFYQIIDCFTAMVDTLGSQSQQYVVHIVMNVVVPTFDMIKESYNAYPEIRLSHFKLLNVLMTKVFSSVQSFNLDIFTSMLDCLLYGVSHPKHDISSIALSCVSGLLSDVDSNPEEDFRRVFYDTFYIKILFQLFNVLTDRSHKFIFSQLVKTLIHLFQIIQKGKVHLDGNPNTDNGVANALAEKLSNDFPHIRPSDLLELSRALIMESANFGQFQELLRNFLIGSKKVLPTDRDLYQSEIEDREMKISGLAGPANPSDGLPEDQICEF